MMKMMTTTELAVALDTTPRTLRKFLRSPDSGVESVGKGARYALPSAKREVNALSKRFTAWQAAAEAKKAETADATDDATDTDATD
jgi:hypothetical protein